MRRLVRVRRTRAPETSVSLWVALLALALGLVLLVRAADLFVVAAEGVALHRRWSPAVIGAVVVGFGTSLPELVTSLLAAWRGEPDLAIGNAAGSNVANLLLILGVAALVVPVRGGADQRPTRDALVAGGAGVLLLVCSLDGTIGPLDGAVLVAALLGAVVWQVRVGRGARLEVDVEVPRGRLGWRLAAGLVGVLVGAQLLVEGATNLAEDAGVPAIVIGSVLVAVGTSLPELATAIASARRGQTQLLLGNLFGSNAFNALMVVGGSALVATVRDDPLPVDTPALAVVAAAAVVTVVAGVVLARRPSVSRPVGAVLVALHLASVPVLLAIS
ncbi:calcium/sodium antiporter [Nitriliruptoraceae bacterium ZYF776]|nr:calcium/sodium antiporter [Profundirhabdus halotolerans]